MGKYKGGCRVAAKKEIIKKEKQFFHIFKSAFL